MAQRGVQDTAAERAGRFLIVGIGGTGKNQQTLGFLDEIQPFGTILFKRNMPDAASLLALTKALATRDPDCLITLDHEGGRVHRLPEPFTHFPPMLTIARGGDPGLLREVARAQALELRAAGFHVSYAPVLDVHTNPDNPVIGGRAFGTTPEEVVHNALPYLQGLAEGGIMGCGKHFPGHGDTQSDSHFELPRVEHDAGRLRSLEMVPFARAITQGIPMIMTAHVVYPSLDPDWPASLSETIIEGRLRRELGFTGAVVSDDLEMKAVSARWGVGDAAVRAVEAGSDLLLVCNTSELVREAHAALTAAIEEGRIDEGRIERSERRRRKLLDRVRKLAAIAADDSMIGAQAHRDLASRCV
jgi:beta-N-acetylhexosaminidase